MLKDIGTISRKGNPFKIITGTNEDFPLTDDEMIFYHVLELGLNPQHESAEAR